MAKVSSTQDERPPVDETLEHIGTIAAGVGRPIRIRLAPDLYDYEKQGYNSWHTLSWSVEVQDVEEGRRLRKGLNDFLHAFGATPKSQAAVLKAVAREAVL